MEPGLLDRIIAAFESATQAGALAIVGVALAALTWCALVSWYRDYGTLILAGSGSMGDALASALLRLLSIGAVDWLIVNGVTMVSMLLSSATTLGGMVSGDPTMGEVLRHPSALLTAGAAVASPLLTLSDRMTANGGWAAVANIPKSWGLLAAWIFVVISFALVAAHLVFLFIEFYIAALMALLLVPWQIYGSSAFLAEFGIGWVLGATLRVVVLGAILSLFYPLLAVLMPLTAPGAIGPDPTYFQIVLIVVTTVIFSIVTWFVPARTAGLVARGLSLSGNVVLAAASTGARGMLLTQSVIRGTSQMLKTRTA